MFCEQQLNMHIIMISEGSWDTEVVAAENSALPS